MNLQLTVYYKSVKKWKYVLKKQSKTKQNDQKKEKKKSNHGPSTGEVNALPIAPQQLMLNRVAKFILYLKFFAHEILPKDAAWSW